MAFSFDHAGRLLEQSLEGVGLRSAYIRPRFPGKKKELECEFVKHFSFAKKYGSVIFFGECSRFASILSYYIPVWLPRRRGNLLLCGLYSCLAASAPREFIVMSFFVWLHCRRERLYCCRLYIPVWLPRRRGNLLLCGLYSCLAASAPREFIVMSFSVWLHCRRERLYCCRLYSCLAASAPREFIVMSFFVCLHWLRERVLLCTIFLFGCLGAAGIYCVDYIPVWLPGRRGNLLLCPSLFGCTGAARGYCCVLYSCIPVWLFRRRGNLLLCHSLFGYTEATRGHCCGLYLRVHDWLFLSTVF